MTKHDALVARALLLAVREHDWSQPVADIGGLLAVGLDVGGLVEAAAWHRVDGCVWLSIRGAGTREVEPPAAAALLLLENHYLSAIANHLKMSADLRSVADIFDRAGIGFAVVKGPVLAAVIYQRPDLRSYQDLDVLVAPASLGDALEHLEAAGAVVLDENWDLLTECGAGEVRVQLASGTMLDLHWSLFNDPAVRRTFSVATETLLLRAVRVRIAGRDVPGLEPTDALVHVAVHACMAGGNKLGWLKDVEQSLSHRFLGWPALVDRCGEWRAGIAVATVLARTRRALKTPVPTQVLGALAPAAWRGVVALTDRVSPVTRTASDGSLSRLVARASRRGAAPSVIELVRRGGARAASATHPARGRPGGDRFDESSASFPSGQRARFLAEIRRQP